MTAGAMSPTHSNERLFDDQADLRLPPTLYVMFYVMVTPVMTTGLCTV